VNSIDFMNLPFVKLGRGTLITVALLGTATVVRLALAGCAVGPNYKRPTTETPAHYKSETLGSWKEGQPGDHVPKGDWWNIFADETLNDLQNRATWRGISPCFLQAKRHPAVRVYLRRLAA